MLLLLIMILMLIKGVSSEYFNLFVPSSKNLHFSVFRDIDDSQTLIKLLLRLQLFPSELFRVYVLELTCDNWHGSSFGFGGKWPCSG